MADRDAFSVGEFARRHSVSAGLVYALWRRGLGPEFFRIGGRRVISCEAAERWRREQEEAAMGPKAA
jgi:hypothetical protein